MAKANTNQSLPLEGGASSMGYIPAAGIAAVVLVQGVSASWGAVERQTYGVRAPYLENPSPQ